MRIAYADPPYPGMTRFYGGDNDPFEGQVAEVDHAELVARMHAEYHGWVLHTASTTLAEVLAVCPPPSEGVRVMAWVKPFASFKRGVLVAYAWEPVIVKPARVPKHDPENLRPTVRDWISEPITLKRGLTGAKPEAVCRWAFEVVGAAPDDELDDLYPGTGAVGRAWDAWRSQLGLFASDHPS